MILPKGTTVYPSERGHYNFHYPQKDKPYELSLDIQVKDLHWVRQDNMIPVEVISPKNYLPYVVLWIDPPV
jgi:hypothetical protein